MIDIVELDREKYQNYELDFDYESDYYYDLITEKTDNSFNFSFVKKKFEKTFHKGKDIEKLFEPFWEEVMCFAIMDGDKPVAVAETCIEGWCNRRRLVDLWVHPDYRRRGYAKALMNRVKQQAIENENRCLILEAQSCNDHALSFYFSEGFTIGGFNCCEYSNEDVEKKEVRLELVYFLNKIS